LPGHWRGGLGPPLSMPVLLGWVNTDYLVFSLFIVCLFLVQNVWRYLAQVVFLWADYPFCHRRSTEENSLLPSNVASSCLRPPPEPALFVCLISSPNAVWYSIMCWYITFSFTVAFSDWLHITIYFSARCVVSNHTCKGSGLFIDSMLLALNFFGWCKMYHTTLYTLSLNIMYSSLQHQQPCSCVFFVALNAVFLFVLCLTAPCLLQLC